jgi:hypothetical protein
MSDTCVERELVLITNTEIAETQLSHRVLLKLTQQQHVCELGSPEEPYVEDYIPMQFVSDEVRQTVERYKTIDPKHAIAVVMSSRIDVAGNLVGVVRVLNNHPKADTVKKALLKHKSGVRIIPRIGHEYNTGSRRETVVFAFDVGFV